MNSVFQPAQAATLGLLVSDVMDAYKVNVANLTPAPLAGSSLATDWVIDGYLVARDALLLDTLVPADTTVYYGVLAHRKDDSGKFAAVIRGTNGFREWLIDADCVMVPHPSQGRGSVEAGFFGLYQSMAYLPADNPAASTAPAWKGIQNVVGTHPVVVVGHSLGGALATYLTSDLATGGNLGASLSSCFFASARPGDASFAAAFGKVVGSYTAYAYQPDVVPDLPPGILGFRELDNLQVLTPQDGQALITDSILDNHHILTYCALLDYTLVPDWAPLLARDGDDANTIEGPNPTVETVALA